MKTRFTILVCMTLLLGIALSARAQMEIPKPAPELTKLDYFAGTWTTEGDIKPGPMGPRRQIHRNKPRPVDGPWILPGDPLRVQWRHWQRYGNVLHGLRTATTRCTPTTLSFNTLGEKPTTPRAMWTATFGRLSSKCRPMAPPGTP